MCTSMVIYGTSNVVRSIQKLEKGNNYNQSKLCMILVSHNYEMQCICIYTVVFFVHW